MDATAGMCPSCDEIVEVEHPEVGWEVDCPNCGAALAVASSDPLVLRYALDTEDEPPAEDDPLL